MEVLINFMEAQFTYNKCIHFKCIVPGVLINVDTHMHPHQYKNIFITTKSSLMPFAVNYPHSPPQVTTYPVSLSIA